MVGEIEGSMETVGDCVGVRDGLGLGAAEKVGDSVGIGVVGAVGTAC